jgi:hypothetical protein
LKASHERKHYRFPVNLEGQLYDPKKSAMLARIRLDNLSVSGAGFYMDHKLAEMNESTLLHFDTPDHLCIVLPVTKIHHQHIDSSGMVHAGMSFSVPPGLYRERLFEYLFVYIARHQTLQTLKEQHTGRAHVLAAMANQKSLSFRPPQLSSER